MAVFMQGLRFCGDPAFLASKKNATASIIFQNKGNKRGFPLLFSAGESIILYITNRSFAMK